MQMQAQAQVETQEMAAGPPIEVTDTVQVLPMPGQERRGLTAPAWVRAVLRNRKAAVGVVILVLFAVVALLAPVLAPGDPGDFVARPHLPPSTEHIFGTTGQGNDVFSQTVWGGRATLSIGILVGVLTTVVGIIVGLSSGYFGGITDDVSRC